MRIRKKNVVRLASFSALGAGTLGVGMGTAEAAVIYQPLGVTLGFSETTRAETVNLPGGAAKFTFRALSHPGTYSANYSGRMVRFAGKGVTFKYSGFDVLAVRPPGVTWSALGAFTATSDLVGERARGGYWIGTRLTGHFFCGACSWTIDGNRSFSSEYALFQFNDPTNSPTELFGWLELSESVSVSPPSGPDVTLIGYAYDTSGNHLPAGSEGETPEPSTLALGGLAALALGSTGLRRWRAARKAVA
jgi:hypothetical protein